MTIVGVILSYCTYNKFDISIWIWPISYTDIFISFLKEADIHLFICWITSTNDGAKWKMKKNETREIQIEKFENENLKILKKGLLNRFGHNGLQGWYWRPISFISSKNSLAYLSKARRGSQTSNAECCA